MFVIAFSSARPCQATSFPPSPLLQLLAGLVKHSNNSSTATYKPVLSRRFGSVLLGNYRVNLELDDDLRLVTFKFCVENAVGLLQQVCAAESFRSTRS